MCQGAERWHAEQLEFASATALAVRSCLGVQLLLASTPGAQATLFSVRSGG